MLSNTDQVAELIAETVRIMHIEETSIETATRIVVNDKGVPELFDTVRVATAELLAINSAISKAAATTE